MKITSILGIYDSYLLLLGKIKKKKEILKFHLNKSADFEEEKPPSIKAGTVICFKYFHVCRSGSKISAHRR